MDYKEKYGNTLGLVHSPYDKRDYKFSDIAPVGAFRIPNNYESEMPSFIYDQGQSSMCCACSYNTIRYMQERSHEQSGLTEPLSPCFTYGNRLGTNAPTDVYEGEGMMLRDCCKKGRDGSVLLSELPQFCSYPKAKELVNSRKEELLGKAAPFAIDSFYVCRSRREMQIAIMETQAILVGIPVYDCFYEPDSEGRVLYNPATCTGDGSGHAQVFCGWRTDEDGKLWWKSINSWSKDWSTDGYSWIPEDYPLMDAPYALIDKIDILKFREYKEKYYGE